MLSKGLLLEQGVIFKDVVSGRRFKRLLHGFWGRIRGWLNYIWYYHWETGFFQRGGGGDKYNPTKFLIFLKFYLT
jgi:hypothetical protein